MSKVAMKAESPMVKAGKMMCTLMVNANCRRASNTAVIEASIARQAAYCGLDRVR
jgi:hypothetical protein